MKFVYFFSLSVIVVLFLGACQAVKKDLHPLTFKLIASGIQFDANDNGRSGFGTYAVSPEYKAFAASVGKNGLLGAWGKG